MKTLYGTVVKDGTKYVCKKVNGDIAEAMGERLTFKSAFGGLFKHDLGKRIYLIDGVFQMENAEQLAKRLEAKSCQILTLEENEAGKYWKLAAHGARFTLKDAQDFTAMLNRPFQIVEIPE